MFTYYYDFLLINVIKILVFKSRFYPFFFACCKLDHLPAWVIPPSLHCNLHSATTFTPPQPCLCKSQYPGTTLLFFTPTVVRIVEYFVENLKEEYLVFIAETIPFLDELVEDVELSVKSLAQRILQDMESLSGESLRQYL
ncbi:Uncharacterized protein HKD37_11G032204 [Glycine soja]